MEKSLIRKPFSILLILIVIAFALNFKTNTSQHPNWPSNWRQDVPSVSAKQAQSLIDQGAVVIDVRGHGAFTSHHIPGALPVPLETLEMAIPATLVTAKDKPVVVYCGDGSTRGPEATMVLRQAGFTQAVNLEQGFDGWSLAGLPVLTGS